ADHIGIEVGNGVFQWENRILGIEFRTYKAFFLSGEKQEQHRSFRSVAILFSFFESFCDLQDSHGSRTSVIGSIVDVSLVIDTFVIIVRGDHQYFIRIGGSLNIGQDVFSVLHGTSSEKTARDFLVIIIAANGGGDTQLLKLVLQVFGSLLLARFSALT